MAITIVMFIQSGSMESKPFSYYHDCFKCKEKYLTIFKILLRVYCSVNKQLSKFHNSFGIY